MPLTAAQIQLHPEFPHVHWDLPVTKSGKVSVAKGRGGPFKIAYEIHGHGPRKIVWITGLGGFMKTWQRQVKDFGHTQADKYTCLVLDNRGMGDSDKPLLRYTTSEMAKDVVELLDHVGWTQPRSVHVVGISMGAPRVVRTLPFLENVRHRINLMIPKTIDKQLTKVKADCYTPEWLVKPDETEHTVQPFPTNGDRFAAAELSKRMSVGKFTRIGFLCQLYAAGFHYKSTADMKRLGDQIGRNRILVLHGEGDHMITFTPHAQLLLNELGGEAAGVTKHHITKLGHVAPFEIRHEFNKMIADMVERTEAL